MDEWMIERVSEKVDEWVSGCVKMLRFIWHVVYSLSERAIKMNDENNKNDADDDKLFVTWTVEGYCGLWV